MMDTIFVHVAYSTEDEESGPVFLACNDDLMFTEEMLQNVREAIALCMEDDVLVAELGLIPNPQIVFNTAIEYAETA